MSGDVTWTIEVDRGACIGNRMCVASAPDLFEIIDGKSRARTAQIRPPSKPLVEAFESCPISAIVIRDEAGEEIEPES